MFLKLQIQINNKIFITWKITYVIKIIPFIKTFLVFSDTIVFTLDCELLERLPDFSLEADLAFLLEQSEERDLEWYLCLSLPFELLFLELL